MMTHKEPYFPHMQWRIDVMNKQFGPCGIGWKYEIADRWTEPVVFDEVRFFVQINLYIRNKTEGTWHHPIPGIGNSMLVEKKANGLHSPALSPERAIADALSIPMMAVLGDRWENSDGLPFKYNIHLSESPKVKSGGPR